MASQWSPGAIFSPSQARQQQAQAKDWNYIDTWLSVKYSPKSAPPFERNNETLKALLALASWNEGVDEERALVAKVEAKALEELKAEAETDADAEVLEGLNHSLTREGRRSLESIAALSVSLGSTSVDQAKLGRSIIGLTKLRFDLEQQTQRVEVLRGKLQSDLDLLRNTLSKVQSDEFTPSPSLPQKTAEWNRATKILTTKVQEYKDRLVSLGDEEPPHPSLPEIIAEEKEIAALKARVILLETQVKAFQGLPHDIDLAKLEVGRVRRELEKLTRQRDKLFEGLVEGRGDSNYF
ncbi:hypothetical protein FGG08_001752 [Glutinoglossum americanum]|uniref:HAUS augmin-like complex subunit 1 n=1 Tax=Glutinoglossum americanum TaxID=1670608 RepID=A0A9P8I672_9PEZI|nr:hypothetical protein FGG08_001752 [Glutinoglossum americanum]